MATKQNLTAQPKLYKNYFLDSLETQYATGLTPFTALIQAKSKIKLVPQVATEGSETGNTSQQYIIQRMKRLKSIKTTENYSDGAGDSFIKRLNSAARINWETFGILKTEKRDILVHINKNEIFDPNGQNSQGVLRSLANKTQNELATIEEYMLGKIVDDYQAKAHIFTTDGSIAKNQQLIEGVDEIITNISLLVDDYKAYSNSDNIKIFVHPYLQKIYSSVQGQAYTQGTNTFPKGIGNSFRYNNFEFYVANMLNSFSWTDSATKIMYTPVAIIMDIEGMAATDPLSSFENIDQILMDEHVVGSSYSFGFEVVDKKRIALIGMKIPTSIVKSKSVNA